MKKNYIYILAAICLFVSCTDGNLTPPEMEGDCSLQIAGSISQVFKTRVNDSGFCEGDGVGVYAVNYAGSTPGELKESGNQVDNVKYVLKEGNKWVSETKAGFKDKNTHADIYGYYPYNASVSSIESYPFEIRKDQNIWLDSEKMSGYEASDFLWACATDVTPSQNIVDLEFKHKMASLSVTLMEGEGWTSSEWANVTKSVLVTNTRRAAEIDLSSGMVTASGEVSNTGIIPQHGNADSWRAIVVPQSVAVGKAIVAITVDGKTRNLTKEEAYTYYQGKMNTLAVSVDKTSDGSGIELRIESEGILAWENDDQSHDAVNQEYIIVNCPEPGKLSEAVSAEGYDLTKIKHLKIVGKINQDDFTLMRESMTALQSLHLYETSIFDGLVEIYSLPNRALYEKKTLNRIVLPRNLKETGSEAFVGTSLIGTLIIPEGIEIVSYGSFRDVGTLTGLELPSTVKIIDYTAFYRCSSISSNLVLPKSLQEIGEFAFSDCYSISGQLILPSGLNSIGSAAFQSCRSLSGSLNIPDGITEIKGNTFAFCEGLSGNLTLGKSLKRIEERAFLGCKLKGELVLPDGLKQVGQYAFASNSFTALSLPHSIRTIGPYAFINNPLGGIIYLPNGMTSLNSNVFSNCYMIEGIEIPSSMEYIGKEAFSGCYNVSSIICKAEVPPTLMNGVFDNVPKDNFTVEVHESAIASYSNEAGWREFKRFSAYRDFSVNRKITRFLGKKASSTLLIRAQSNMEWEISSIPDWLNVDKVSGKGKTEITITASDLDSGSRKGELTITLVGKDASLTAKVEQYAYQYSDGDVIVNQTHTKGNGVNLVFMGDCYDAKDIAEGNYLSNINEAIGYFFDIEPYKTYKDYFDVYTVLGVSEDSGVGTSSTIRNAKFGSQYTVAEGVKPDFTTCFKYACKAPINNDIPNSLVCLVLNTTDYGGITYVFEDGTSVAVCPMSNSPAPNDFRGIIHHEAGGHGFGKLGDEQIYYHMFIQGTTEEQNLIDMKVLGYYDNLSLTGDFQAVPWAHMIYDPKYSDYVDVYEGGFYFTRGVFRSEANSCMNNHIPYYSAISRESIVRRIMEKAGEPFSFESFKEKDNATGNPSARSAATKGIMMPRAGMHYSPVLVGKNYKVKTKN